jgi:hypothetical protein
MLLLAGIALLALGLLSGVVLVLAPLNIVGADPGLTLWLSFPLLSVVGFSLIAARTKGSQLRVMSLASSALLLLLAVSSMGALVLGEAAFIPAPTTTAPLWFVLVVGLSLGSLGAASFGRKTAQA